MPLRKLTSYSQENRLYRAFRELGSVIRTIFLLQYISDAKLHEIIQQTVNLGNTRVWYLSSLFILWMKREKRAKKDDFWTKEVSYKEKKIAS